jgi:penicillin-binding protein 2
MRQKISPYQTIRGYAFGEFIHDESYGKRKHYSVSDDKKSLRGYVLVILLLLCFIFLFLRAIDLTIVHGGDYRVLADSNRVRTAIIHAPRGIIFDRNGKPLVYNTPGFRQVRSDSVTILDREQALSLLAKGEKNIEIDTLRKYPYKDAFAHVIGYIGQITQEELQTHPEYRGYDFLGKEGIEQAYEASLKGVDGKTLVEVDAMGKPVRVLGSTDPFSGKDITTTLDSDIQLKTFDAMKDVQKGSAIVSTPQGQILAMVSKPSFDPNLFTMGMTYKIGTSSGYQKIADVLLDSTTQPLLNRSISGTYPPGSTFKLVTAIAGLETQSIDKHFSIDDPGIMKIGEFSFGNWYFLQYGKKDGVVDVVKAIKRSNDIFFYQLAAKVGVDHLSDVARQFGVGQVLGIDLVGEAKGLVPTKSWKEKNLHEQWFLGDTYHYGIGQGYLLTTPLQVNVWTQAIANGGSIYRPRLVEKNEDPIIAKVPISEDNISLIKQGMREACQPGGVAWPLFNFRVKNKELRSKIDNKNYYIPSAATNSAELKDMVEISVACKTGTAQHGDEKTLPHAWITLFAPAQNPQIVITVLNESSGEGSNEAAPVAKKILEAWFSR